MRYRAMIKPLTVAVSAACLALAACVTINIYFPAAAAEKAADKIIQDVWGEQRKAAPGDSPPAPRDGAESTAPHSGSLLDLLVTPALAQANFNISTPAIKRLESSMKVRFPQLAPYYDSGAVGLTRDGLVEVRDLKAVPIDQRSRVRQLVADENRDRNALYKEVAVANGHPEWESDVRSTFARRWVANAGRGWWYQDAAGGWKRK